MPHAAISTVLFDLGNTLMHPRDPWEPVLDRAYQALADRLHAHGIQVDRAGFHREFEDHLSEYYRQRNDHQRETSTLTALSSLLELNNIHDTPIEILREALDAMYAVTQSNWFLEDDAIPTLQALRRDGYRMAVVSNAGDDKDVQQLIDKFGIRPYFESILTSAACTWRKPHRAIFEHILGEMKVKPAQAAMVGDRLEADILGANALGIYSVWIERRAGLQEYRDSIHPRAVITHLAGLPILLSSLRGPSAA